MRSDAKLFINKILDEILEEKGGFVLTPTKTLDNNCSGEFESNCYPKISVATGKPFKRWFPILVHEYSHFLQWKDRKSIWYNKTCDTAYSKYFQLLDTPHVTSEELFNLQIWVQRLEQDCDRRAVEIIEKYSLPIDIKLYIRQSNSYIWYYNVVSELCLWRSAKSPYDVSTIQENCPSSFIPESRYLKPSKKMVTLIKERCYSKHARRSII